MTGSVSMHHFGKVGSVQYKHVAHAEDMMPTQKALEVNFLAINPAQHIVACMSLSLW